MSSLICRTLKSMRLPMLRFTFYPLDCYLRDRKGVTKSLALLSFFVNPFRNGRVTIVVSPATLSCCLSEGQKLIRLK